MIHGSTSAQVISKYICVTKSFFQCHCFPFHDETTSGLLFVKPTTWCPQSCLTLVYKDTLTFCIQGKIIVNEKPCEMDYLLSESQLKCKVTLKEKA